jgi:hypothetical protein
MTDIPYLKLPYVGASSIENVDGATIAECVTPDIAEALVNIVNTALFVASQGKAPALRLPAELLKEVTS